MAVELDPPPSVAELAERTADVRPRGRGAGGGAVRGSGTGRRRPPRAAGRGPCGRRVRPARERRVRRPRAGHARPGGGVRGGGLVAARPARAATSPPRTKATCTCWRRSPTAEQKERYLRPLAAGDLRSCFAMTEPAPGCGLRPAGAADPRRARARRLADRRPQVVHHRCRRRRLRDLHGPDLGRSRRPRAARRCSSSTPPTRACGCCGTSRPSTRACPAATPRCVRRLRRAATTRARRGRRGFPVRPGPARPGADDALHALAGHRPPGAGHRGGPGRGAASCSARGWPTSAWRSR